MKSLENARMPSLKDKLLNAEVGGVVQEAVKKVKKIIKRNK